MNLAILMLKLRRQGVVFDVEMDPPYSGPTAVLTPEVVRTLDSERDHLLHLLDPEGHDPGDGPPGDTGTASPATGQSPDPGDPPAGASPPESLPPVRKASRPTWADLSPGERAIIQKARNAYPQDFDRLLIGYFAEGLISGEAEVRVVLDLLDREIGIDRGEGPSYA